MALVDYPLTQWNGNTDFSIVGTSIQANDIVVVVFASAPGLTEKDIISPWSLLGKLETKGWAQWFGEDVTLYFAGARWATAVTVTQNYVTRSANRSAVKVDSPVDGLAYLFRGASSVTVATTPTNNMYSELSEYPPAPSKPDLIETLYGEPGANFVDIVYGQVIAGGESCYLKDVDAFGATTYSKSIVRVASATDARKTRPVVKKIDIEWLDGKMETKEIAGPHYITAGLFTIASSTNNDYPTAAFSTPPEWVDVTKPVTLRWQYLSRLNGAQTGWALRRGDTSFSYWNATSSTWDSTEVVNQGTTSSMVLPANALTSGVTPETLSLRVVGALGTGGYDAKLRVDVAKPPKATATIKTSTTKNSETSITVIPFFFAQQTGAAYAPRSWDCQILDSTGALVMQKTAPQVTPWDLTLPRAGSYTVKVRVTQNSGGVSDWASYPVTVAATVPTAPVLTAVAATHRTSGAPCVRLTTSFPWAGQAFPWGEKRVRLRVQRRTTGGAWVSVGLLGPYVSRTMFELDDYVAPSGTNVTYRVRGESQRRDGTFEEGPWSAETPAVAVTVDCGWIVDPYRPETAVKVALASEEARRWETGADVRYALGESYGAVTRGQAHAFTSALTVRVPGASEEQRLLDAVTVADRLLVRWHGEENARTKVVEPPRDLWMAVVGSVEVARNRPGPTASREITLPYVAQPPYVAPEA